MWEVMKVNETLPAPDRFGHSDCWFLGTRIFFLGFSVVVQGVILPNQATVC